MKVENAVLERLNIATPPINSAREKLLLVPSGCVRLRQ